MSYITDGFDKKVVELLNEGAVGFMPTDTIYGLSCRALNEKAVERLHQLKGRSHNKPLIVLISDLKMLALPKNLSGVVGNQITEYQVFGSGLDALGVRYNKVITLVEKYWPGPLTVIFDAPRSPKWLHRGTKTLAVRMPAVADLQNLIKQVGPLVSTSANAEGERPAQSVEQARKYFGEQLDFYIDVGKVKTQPSTIARVEKSKLKLVRQGAIKI
ncbi:TPA: hypothetical protein DIS56_00085 [Candidatus Saccharibacteria bacterium]|nr:MAG: hypothetical protein A3F05_01495 [Candidatus Saccharibacteria bacterium RIFCSPHIGHO2_12_FULL_47_17]HCM51527.1 hypothetical protein [Candidatus Saccharibacteria bacterium]